VRLEHTPRGALPLTPPLFSEHWPLVPRSPPHNEYVSLGVSPLAERPCSPSVCLCDQTAALQPRLCLDTSLLALSHCYGPLLTPSAGLRIHASPHQAIAGGQQCRPATRVSGCLSKSSAGPRTDVDEDELLAAALHERDVERLVGLMVHQRVAAGVGADAVPPHLRSGSMCQAARSVY